MEYLLVANKIVTSISQIDTSTFYKLNVKTPCIIVSSI